MSIGQVLATARRDAGLSIADVGRATCIRETIISGIERDEFELCGGHFYARGHIRSIAQAVGLDAQPLVQQYDDEHGGSPRATTPSTPAGPAGMGASRERRGRPNWSMVMAVLLVAVVVFGVFELFGGTTGSEQPNRAGHNPVAGGSASGGADGKKAAGGGGPADGNKPDNANDQGKHGDKQGNNKANNQGNKQGNKRGNKQGQKHAGKGKSAKGATVRLVARAPTWISAEGPGGKKLYSGTLQSGDSKKFTSRQLIELQIGNMGGVAITVNGKKFGVVGSDGAVRDVTVYPDRVEGISG